MHDTFYLQMEAIAYGSHGSARAHQAFLREELANMVKAWHWLALPYAAIHQEPTLHISPMGVVPQLARCPRPIADYTSTGINNSTQRLAPPEDMQLSGKALPRKFHKVAKVNPLHGPVFLSKYDLADAFMRVSLVSLAMVLKLAVAVPNLPGEPPLVAGGAPGAPNGLV